MFILSFCDLAVGLLFGEAGRDIDITPPFSCDRAKLEEVHPFILPEDRVIACDIWRVNVIFEEGPCGFVNYQSPLPTSQNIDIYHKTQSPLHH